MTMTDQKKLALITDNETILAGIESSVRGLQQLMANTEKPTTLAAYQDAICAYRQSWRRSRYLINLIQQDTNNN